MVKIYIPGQWVGELGGVWKTSPLIYPISWKPDGRYERVTHLDPNIDPNGGHALVAGAEELIIAAWHCAQELLVAGNEVEVLMISGRPPYMESAPQGINESVLMAEQFNALSGGSVPVRLWTENMTTEDDMRTILSDTMNASADRALVFMLSYRLPRACAIIQDLVVQKPQLQQTAERLTLIAAEIYMSPEQLARVREAYQTRAYRDLMAAEGFGIRKLLHH